MKGVTSMKLSPPPPANDMMVGGDLGNGVIDNIDKEWPRNSSYEGGDINDTIPLPTS